MTINQHAHIYSFHTSNFIFGQIIFLKILSMQPLIWGRGTYDTQCNFKTASASANQRLTFCGVNAHFQNGIAEKAIWDLHESVRKQLLLHAQHWWPAAIHLALWPYALRYATYFHNTLPILDDGTSRLELFSSIWVRMKLRHMHTFGFGCPVFALQNELSSGGTIPHWSPRPRLGINLGPSPDHACNVYLIINLHTGCVSPQFHCFYETVKAWCKPGWPTLWHL
jgi:hypothetical protein